MIRVRKSCAEKRATPGAGSGDDKTWLRRKGIKGPCPYSHCQTGLA